MKPDQFEDDILATPGRLESLADALDRSNPWAGLQSPSPLITGMGSSAYAARTVAGWLRAAGVGAVAELATTDPGWPGGPGASAVLVSASGSSAETLDRSRRLAPDTQRVALVNVLDSPLALQSDLVVDLHAGHEEGEVACRSYRHTLALLLALGLDRADIARSCREAAFTTQQLLADTWWLDAMDAALSPVGTTFWIAPENRIGSAMQSALMVREVPRRPAIGCETGDWSHVDVYLALTMDYRCVLFTGSPWDGQAVDWLRRRGSVVVSIGDPVDIEGEVHIPLNGDPIVRMLVEPLFAELLALRWWRRDPVHVP